MTQLTEDLLVDFEIGESIHGLVDERKLVLAAQGGFLDIATSIRAALPSWPDVSIIFRGQTNRAWGIQSTLYRSLEDKLGHQPTEFELEAAEGRVIDAARRPRGVPHRTQGQRLGLNLTDGELLAVLAHHGCPTRFVDVTDDGRVALYFAVEKDDQLDGRLFFIAMDSSSDATTNITTPGLWLDLGAKPALPWGGAAIGVRDSRGAWSSSVFRAAREHLDPRMSAQGGSFLVGGLNRAYSDRNITYRKRALSANELIDLSSLPIGFRSSLKPNRGQPWPAYSWTMKIPAVLKPLVRKELADAGIDGESIYPDYDAFLELAEEEARHAP